MTMKKILITGANSYVGTSFEKWLSQWPDKYHVDTIDMIDGSWRKKSFAGYDAVFHVAGIAHRKETKQNAHLYYEVNRDLAIETAKKAKADGVRQFIFMSSMSVYGMETGCISKNTATNPKSHYGKSKLEAEQGIKLIADKTFNVVILRPPMIYGNECVGNYQRLRTFVLRYRVFPDVVNKRSMLYINNLCVYIRKCIESIDLSIQYWILMPQDPDYMCTRNMAIKIAECNHIQLRILPFLKFICVMNVGVIKKVFGNLYYKSVDEWSQEGLGFPESIVECEKSRYQ